jgi:hypothetical protein
VGSGACGSSDMSPRYPTLTRPTRLYRRIGKGLEMKSIRRLSLPLLGGLCALGLAAPAGAGQSAASGVTLKVKGGPPFHGRVTSNQPACVPNRKVILLEVAPERAPIDLADNRTNGRGKWVFSSQLQGATVVQAKVAQSKASGVICRSARSGAKRL